MKWHARADGASLLLSYNSFLQAATGWDYGSDKLLEMNKAVPGYADTAFCYGSCRFVVFIPSCVKGGTYATRHISR